jgi:hypothetical protein
MHNSNYKTLMKLFRSISKWPLKYTNLWHTILMKKIILGGKKFEIHSHDQGMLVSVKPSVACSVIHDHNHNMQGVSHIHTFTQLYICQIWLNLSIPKTMSNIHETLAHVLIVHRLSCMTEHRVIACSCCKFKNSYFSLEFELVVSWLILLHPLTVTVFKSPCNITIAVHVVTACNVTIKEGRWNWPIS